jgi:xanthine dehydrogenase small subunit
VAACLAAHPDAVLLAGSTEFGLAVNKRHERPAFIIYLGGVAELRRIDETAADWRIGAAVPLDRVLALVAKDLPDFAEVLRRFGSPPIRATATLGGNIANGSPIGDSMPCLIALGATLVLRRRGSAAAMNSAACRWRLSTPACTPTCCTAGEFIEAIELPRPGAASPPRHFRAHKISKRFEQDISATCAALSWTLQDGVLRDVRLAYNGLSPYPARAPKIEAVLEGKAPADVTAEELDAAIAGSFTHRDGLRATWAYRSLIARNLVLNFVQPAAHTEPA